MDISIAVDICRLKLYVGRHFLVAFSIISMFKPEDLSAEDMLKSVVYN